jgi:hypothetical protein
LLKTMLRELKEHAPFTLFGALTGLALMTTIVLARVTPRVLEPVFEGSHAAHVLLSAIVTTAMCRRYRKSLLACVLIGYVGSVGIGTLSDIILPYLGGMLVGAHMHFHLAFIEHWWLINPVALLGVTVAVVKPATKMPHSGHVMLSTCASLFYLTAHGEAAWLPLLPLVLVVLFVAVWVPCCVSDIIFPLLFVGKREHREQEHHLHV